MSTLTLTEFLLARIAVDYRERVTRFREGRLPTPRELREADRWQAECEAKRRIVELCAPGDWSAPNWRSLGEPGEDDRGDVLALLALPYADHSDYREEWKP